MFFFRRASSNWHDSFMMVFAQNSSIFYWAVHQPIAFFQVWSHTRRFKPLTEELWLPVRCHFSSRVCMGTNQQRNVIIKQDCWIRNTVGMRGVFEDSVILQPILHRKPVRGDLLLCNRWQTSAQHASAAKKSDMNKKKSIKNVMWKDM